MLGPSFDGYRSAFSSRASSSSRHRLPSPSILMLQEGSSQSRWLQCRLIPSHKDPQQWQQLSFPSLQQMTQQQRQQLCQKFLPTDELVKETPNKIVMM